MKGAAGDGSIIPHMPPEADYRRRVAGIQKAQKLSNISNTQQTTTGQFSGARVALGHMEPSVLFQSSLL